MTTANSPTQISSSRFYWRIVIILLWLVAGVAIAFTLKQRYQQKKQATVPVEEKEKPIDLTDKLLPPQHPMGQVSDDPESIDNFSLTDQNGKTVTGKDLLGKPWAVCFVFARCAHSCPAITRMVKEELQDRLENDDVRLVSITVDPENDTPKTLLEYAKFYDANPKKWLFLTGDKQQIFYLIHHSFKQVAYDDVGKPIGFQVAHSNSIIHVDANGVVQKKYDGTDKVDVGRLRHALQKEAKEILKQKKSSNSPPVVAPLPSNQ